MTRIKSLLFVILALLTTSPVFSSDVKELLHKAEIAERYISYRGMKVVTFDFGGKQTTAKFKLLHLMPDKTRTEFYMPDALSGIILIQDGGTFWKYYPKREVWEESPHPIMLPPDVIHEETLHNYELSLVGSGTVAGRPTHIIQAVPRSRYESVRKVWIDKDCYLIMRTQVESPRGAVVNSSAFTKIDINPNDIDQSAFKAQGKIIQARKPGKMDFQVAKPSYLPKGYKLVGISRLSVNGRCSAHLQFSNGAYIISMFQRQQSGDAPLKEIKSRVTNVMTWTRNGIKFTLMGDVPNSELRKIADSTK